LAIADAPHQPVQLELFDSHTARFAKVEEALQQGRLGVAAELAHQVGTRFDLAEAHGLAEQLEQLTVNLSALEDDAERMAIFTEQSSSQLESSQLTGALRTAALRGLHRRVAQAAERQGRTSVLGRPVGWHWLRAEEADKAREALEEAVRQEDALGVSLSLLGDLAFREKAVVAARELYRRAFCEDPYGISVEMIADVVVQALFDDAQDLALDPPPEWVPMVGYAAGLFQLPAEPQGRGGCREFHAALLDARRSPDVAYRRRMKQLAPQLFKRLLEEEKL
jgi:hypothetical protein